MVLSNVRVYCGKRGCPTLTFFGYRYASPESEGVEGGAEVAQVADVEADGDAEADAPVACGREGCYDRTSIGPDCVEALGCRFGFISSCAHPRDWWSRDGDYG